MTFEDIQKANATIRTTDIKNKAYAEVNQRIKAFRMLKPNGSIQTELVSDDGARCVFKAVVTDESGMVLGTGTAFEQKDASFINKTSYIENCETSAVGRALAMCGIGIDVSIASYEEVANAMENQAKPSKDEMQEEVELRAKVLKYINRHKLSKDKVDKICEIYKHESISEFTLADCKHYIKTLESKGGNIDE